MFIPKRFLFVDWEGGGNLPPALTIARCLVDRGHTVRFLGEPCNREEIEATGSAFVSYVHAPHRDSKSPESDFIRDWEAHTPFQAFARTRERLMFGPASAYAQGLPELNAARSRLGLAELSHPFQQLEHAELFLVLSSPAFDFPASRLPPNVGYVGPQLDELPWVQPWSSPWPAAHPDPLVVVSLSTSFQSQGALLQRVINALGGMRVRALVTLGPTLALEELATRGCGHSPVRG
jgi:UDP:flavonoid glycosyltransferase YjiC (YdhE family)